MSSEYLPKCISLPESESGHLPYGKPNGQMIGQSGPAIALATLSARRAKEMGLMMSGTYGQPSTISFASVNLSESLASMWQAITAVHSSTLYKLTSKRRSTPLLRSISAVRASVRRTSGWPTPAACDGKGGYMGGLVNAAGDEHQSAFGRRLREEEGSATGYGAHFTIAGESGRASPALLRRSPANNSGMANANGGWRQPESAPTSIDEQHAAGWLEDSEEVAGLRRSVIAGVAAMANIPPVTSYQNFSIGAGVGNTDGESAVAVGFSARASQSVVVKASVSNDTQRNFVVGGGISYGW